MILLIHGTTHTGKTVLAQKLLEKYHYPYMCIDHLKMGLIRSSNCDIEVEDDEKLTEYLWPIVREMIKTAIENHQHLIVEGCYIPFHWQDDFDDKYLEYIRYVCLVLSKQYIENHYEDILKFANKIEKRLENQPISKEHLIQENEYYLKMCKEVGLDYHLIVDKYDTKDVFNQTSSEK